MRIASALIAFSFVAADWPQFLGPNRDSVSKSSVEAWADAPKVLWKQAVGEAHSSPVVANGLVYAFYRQAGKDDDSDLEVLAAFDATTGARKWEKSLTRKKYATLFGSGPQGTPTVADSRVFTYGNSGILTARNATNGDLLWSIDTLKEFNAKNLVFGIATSPIVVGKTVIAMVGGKDAGIVAFDVATGKPVWQATSDPTSYSSPILHEGQLIFLTGSHLRGLTVAGKEVWAYPFKDRANESSTMPVKIKDGVLGSSITRGSVALTITGAKVKPMWENKTLTCFFSTPIVVDQHVFMINGVTGNTSLFDAAVNLRCVELATGTVLWDNAKVGRYHAAMVRTANDKMLMLDDNGFLTLFALDAGKYRELARSKVCEQTWAHPALVDDKVYLRDHKTLYCLELK